MTDKAGGHTSDADPVRTLVLGLIERVEKFAATVISDREGVSVDVGPAVRVTLDTVIGELGELINSLIAAIVVVLDAVSAAIDEAINARGRSTTRHPPPSASGFQPIAVEVEISEPHL